MFYLCVPAISVSLYAGNGVESICREREVEGGWRERGADREREERTWVEQGEIMEQERTNHFILYSDPHRLSYANQSYQNLSFGQVPKYP